MTNEYGSEQPHEHEQEEHAATPEATVHEGEPGVWTDDQPPHDDFGAANEDMATVSQEAVTDAEQDDTGAPPAKSSRSMLPILAGVGGILLLGGVVYLQFGHSSTPAQPMHLTQAPKPTQQASAELPTQAPPPAADSSSTTSAQTPPPAQAAQNENDINSLYKPAGTPTPVTMPSSSTPIETTLAPIPTPPPTGSVASPSATTNTAAAQVPPAPAPTIAPQAGNPSNPVPPLPGQVFRTTPPAVNAPSAVPTANTNIAASASTNPADATRLSALATRMDALQKSLDQVTNMVAAVPAVANNNNADMENRLNKIEQTLTKIESQQATKSLSPASASKHAASSAVKEPNEESAPPVLHSTKSSSKHNRTRTHTKSASSSTHHRTASAPAPLSPKPGRSNSEWVLRAATPKEAWVSSDPNSQDLRHVQIGESLPGIGTVRSIRQANGGWEIEGSTGIIR